MTTRWRTREGLEHDVVTANTKKVSRRAIARSLGISRNTVRKILATHALQRVEGHSVLVPPPPRVPRLTKLDSYKEEVGKLFVKYPDITAQRVFEIVSESGFDGGYTAVKKLVRKLRPAPKPAPSRVTPDYAPGEMGENDWSPYELTYTTGQTQLIQLFSYVLGWSSRKYFDAFETSDLHALCEGHVRAFDRFNGVPHNSKYDSQKAVVLRWEAGQPIFNPRFLAFAAHYEFRVTAVRGNPNGKARVERSFWEHEKSFLSGRSFRDLHDFRAQLHDWNDRIVDHRRRHGSTALERFRNESPHLLPLPRHPYDTARVIYRICSIDGFADWQGNRYAVPYDHVTDILPLRITQQELFVYAPDLRCLARYQLAPRGANQKLDPYGFHPAPHRQAAIDADQLRLVFEQMGPGGAEFFRLLATGPARVWPHHARRILLLRDRYDTSHIDAACAHAVRFGALEHSAIERILLARHPPRTLDEYVAEEAARRIDAAVGTRPTRPRDLAEYDLLPVVSRPFPATAQQQETIPCPVTRNLPPDPTPPSPKGPASDLPLPTLPPSLPPPPPFPMTSSSPDSDDTSSSSD